MHDFNAGGVKGFTTQPVDPWTLEKNIHYYDAYTRAEKHTHTHTHGAGQGVKYMVQNSNLAFGNN